MSKHNIGDKVTHTRYGTGVVTTVGRKTKTTPAVDKAPLRAEEGRLRARLMEISGLLASPDEATSEEVDAYDVEFHFVKEGPEGEKLARKRVVSMDDYDIDVLKEAAQV